MRSGAPFLLLSMAITPLGDGLSKSLTEALNPFLVAGTRYLVAGLMALAVVRLLGCRMRLSASELPGLLARTMLVMAAMTLLVGSLALVPLAQAVGGFLIAPVCATAFAALWLGERVTPRQLAGTGLSFAGAAVILRPETGFDVGSLMALAGGAALGVYLVATRHARAVDPVATLVVQCLAGGAMVVPIGLAWGGPAAMSPTLAGPVIGLGLVTLSTHFLTVAAYARTQAARLSPLLYFNLVAAWAVGLAWFGESLDPRGTLGVLAIALGGLVAMVPGRPAIPARWRGIPPIGNWSETMRPKT